MLNAEAELFALYLDVADDLDPTCDAGQRAPIYAHLKVERTKDELVYQGTGRQEVEDQAVVVLDQVRTIKREYKEQ